MHFDVLCLLAGMLGLVILLVCYFQLEETLPNQGKLLDTSVSGLAFEICRAPWGLGVGWDVFLRLMNRHKQQL